MKDFFDNAVGAAPGQQMNGAIMEYKKKLLAFEKEVESKIGRSTMNDGDNAHSILSEAFFETEGKTVTLETAVTTTPFLKTLKAIQSVKEILEKFVKQIYEEAYKEARYGEKATGKKGWFTPYSQAQVNESPSMTGFRMLFNSAIKTLGVAKPDKPSAHDVKSKIKSLDSLESITDLKFSNLVKAYIDSQNSFIEPKDKDELSQGKTNFEYELLITAEAIVKSAPEYLSTRVETLPEGVVSSFVADVQNTFGKHSITGEDVFAVY